VPRSCSLLFGKRDIRRLRNRKHKGKRVLVC
jgi:hypothetical protein